MQASNRQRELERKYMARRGHVPQISISDDNHHVTEAIGDMYGDQDYPQRPQRRDARPLSFLPSPHGDALETVPLHKSPTSPLSQSSSKEGTPNGSPKLSRPPSFHGENGTHSPPRLNRNSSDTAQQHFPLNDIDYESSPDAVAKELSNLQAIRRMSMDVNASDPDLPSFNSSFGVPSMAPSPDSDEDDASRLFWVPARLHPELAPKEFKTFIDDRVEKIKRRSGDSESLLSADGLDRSGSGGGLRRKKSTLSRQIDSGVGYTDGAEVLERKRSSRDAHSSMGSLQELEHLVNDPDSMMRRMSLEQTRLSLEGASPDAAPGDVPMLPPKPPGASLKRSTRTNYRRGSLRKGERVYSKRAAARTGDQDSDDASSRPGTSDLADVPSIGIQRTRTEPMPGRPDSVENFSRPARKGRTPPPPGEGLQKPGSISPSVSPPPQETSPTSPYHTESPERRKSPPQSFHSRISSNGRTTARLPGENAPVPSIIETPPAEQNRAPTHFQPPARTSSFDHQRPQQATSPTQQRPLQPQPTRPQQQYQQPQPSSSNQHSARDVNFDDFLSRGSAYPANASRADSLSVIPSYDEEPRKSDGRKSKKKDDGAEESGRKTSWGWLLRNDDKNKDGSKDPEREGSKKSRLKPNKAGSSADKSRDNTRLDVLQTSIDGSGKGRESLVLDRESVKLEEERRKDSVRRATGQDKKEKDSGLFSSLFGGKKKGDRESSHHKKASSLRGLSPEPPPRILRPDIDYNWTRFSIMEERAIYRMAHFKLANPRRELYSQVLLSNFMYSYLAKVQQMHPHMNLPQSAAQKNQQARQAQQQRDQPEEFSQYQRYQEQQARNEQESQSYDDGHHETEEDSDYHSSGYNRPDSRAAQHSQYYGGSDRQYSVSSGQNYRGQGSHQQNYYQQQDLFEDEEPPRDDDMW